MAGGCSTPISTLMVTLHSSSVSIIPLPLSYKDTCHFTGAYPDNKDNLPISRSIITSAKSLLPYKATYKFTGSGNIRIWTFLGVAIQPTIDVLIREDGRGVRQDLK